MNKYLSIFNGLTLSQRSAFLLSIPADQRALFAFAGEAGKTPPKNNAKNGSLGGKAAGALYVAKPPPHVVKIVRKFLLKQNKPVSTMAVANSVGLTKIAASQTLNELTRRGEVVKTQTSSHEYLWRPLGGIL